MRKALEPNYDCFGIDDRRIREISAARGEPGSIKPRRTKKQFFRALWMVAAAFAFGVILVITILR